MMDSSYRLLVLGAKMKSKFRVKQRLCRVGGFMIILCYLFGILCVFEPRLVPILVVLVVDTVLTILPSYFAVSETEGS